MQHSNPVLSEIYLELKDLRFYCPEEVKLGSIEIELEFNASYTKGNNLVLFIHIRYFLKDENDVEQTLFHTDYLSYTEIKDADWNSIELVELDKRLVAHILGMSFLMIRGSISQRLSYNPLSRVRIPIINPLEVLENVLVSKEGNFIIPKELNIHA